MFNFGNIKIKREKRKKERAGGGRGAEFFVYLLQKNTKKNGRKHFHFDDASQLFPPVNKFLLQ